MNKWLIIILAGFFMGVSSFAAEAKFGYINIQKAMSKTKAGKKLRASLEKEFKTRKKKIQAMESEIKKMKEDIDKKSLIMTKETKEQKQRAFQQKYMKFQQSFSKSQREMQQLQIKKTKPIIEKLRLVISQYAKKGGYSMIFEKSEQNVMWAKSSLDITDGVVKAFEKKK